ncbi:PREDICTED: DNA-directed RNA polymerase III subunit RPC8 [Polistes canadensis]|uniref:DNA-directed RNA polymerase III subunit RPC8 n=1 Tax=Polistes canadensis TaxID=91411 RepID=UPI000718F744|nr:PREDICTED: DNA-directed RNA polymerase III subunit RPC8 [Polistes canadensis]XP_014613076.1 PREDICTED: DNA-directed RNA polymerase III subunit RPC8 [Polistes canadensis]XP_014613077.1 PREDICTED: DNA-directed RNA polymerase III subunit RPC8 [Polistes canadensis]XP_014613079.1 PREDICTED: DNA-directed RNA polymerase III subunit RPC8 [Polistes canadensis]
MFVLVELKDTVRIPPWKFKRKLNDAITEELNRKLANKVYLNVGLCIALHDITKIEESYIFPGDGSSHTKVFFRFIVFRPFMEEILIGKIRSCSADGVYVTLGFFEDILIPPHKLQHASRFDQVEQVWIWEYDTGDGGKHDLFMDPGESIRFRIFEEDFKETLPTGPRNSNQNVEKTEASNVSPYSLNGAIDEPGLGLLSWWENA